MPEYRKTTIDRAQERLNDRKDAYLRDRGWRQTSDNPGSYWLWSREFNGRTYMVERDFAVTLQDRIDRDGPGTKP